MTTTSIVAEGTRRPRRTGTRILASVAVLAVAGGALTISSLALFTDQESVPGNAFSTGSVDLTTSPTSVAITDLSMAPGDQVTSPLTVGNAGSLQFRYSMLSTTTENTLAAQLVMTVKTGVTSCTDANWTADGAIIYSGVLGTTAGTAAIGSSAQGAQAGDRVLNAGTNEVLCFNVTLPTNATNASQNLSTTATFRFDAEQTLNN